MIRRLASALVFAALAVAVLVFTGATDDAAKGTRYKLVFDSAFGLVEGGDLKVGGVIAGKTTGFELEERPPYRVVVEAELTEPGFDALRKDARCDVRQQSLIGEYFVDCDVGSAEAPKLPDGGRVPVEQTSSTIPLDLIQNIMRRPYRERFRIILSELGTGLAGRPQDLNEVVRRAHPALRETSETFRILARQNRLIRDFIENSDQVSAAVEPFREDVATWAEESSETAGIQASRSRELARYWNRLPVFLSELEPTMAQLEETADRQIPTLRKLRAAAPALERFLGEVEPFARASRGSLAALGEAAATGQEALTESREEVAELRELSEQAPRLGEPLRKFLQTIDDRSRSYESDPEAAPRAPPAPDKTAYRDGQGYTGMENLLNYIYWQTLGINAYDELGHLLRIGLFTGGPCSRYAARPTEEVQETCNTWLGPFQPGVTAPDPTAGEQVSTPSRATPGRRNRVAQTGPGGPRATAPEAGEPDRSRPRFVMPNGVRELTDRLESLLDQPLTQPGGPQPATPDALLDYLLG